MRPRLLFAISFLSLFSSAQIPTTKYPQGVYMSFEELKTQSPSRRCRLKVIGRTVDAQFWVGGTENKLLPLDKCISKWEINHEAWAYAEDSTLYINCDKLKLNQFYYAQVVTFGRFLSFWNKTIKDGIVAASALGGVIGGMIATAATPNPFENTLYVIDTHSAKLFWVNSELMLKLLEEYPPLLEAFKQEKMENPMVHLKYLQLANDFGN